MIVECDIGETAYFGGPATNDTGGSAADASSGPTGYAHLVGATVNAAPITAGITVSLLSDAGWPAGCYQTAVAATVGNGFAAGSDYDIFVQGTVDSETPVGYIGRLRVRAANSQTDDMITRVLLALPAAAAGATGGLGIVDANGRVPADMQEISGDSVAADNLEAMCDGNGAVLYATHIDGDLDGKVLGTGTGTITGTGVQASVAALTAAGITAVASAVWDALTSGMTTVGSIGKKLADWVLGSDSKVLLSTDAQTGVTIPLVTAVTTVNGLAADAVSASALKDDAVTEIVAGLLGGDWASYEAGAESGTTVGAALALIRAAVAGRIAISGTTLTVYEADGVTTIATYTIASDYSTRSAPS